MKKAFYVPVILISACLAFLALRQWQAENTYPLKSGFTSGGFSPAVTDEVSAVLARRAETVFPGNYRYHAVLGKYYLFGVQPDKIGQAREEFETALYLNPFYSEAFAYLAWADFSDGKPAEALMKLEKAISYEPDNYFIRIFYGTSIVNFIDALPENLKGVYLYRAGEEIKRGIEINPRLAGHPSVLTSRAGIFLIKGDINGAIKEMEKLKDIDSGTLSVHLKLAELYVKAGRKHDAVKKFDKVLGYAGPGSEERRKAIVSLSRAVEEGGGGLKLLLGRAYYEEKENYKALKVLKEASKDASGQPGFYYLLGNVYEAIGDREEAYNNYLKTLQYASRHPGAERKVREYLRGHADGGSFKSSPP